MSTTDQQARRVAVVHRYLTALGEGDTDGVLALFAPGAEVRSPLMGRMPAARFFARLAQESAASRLTVYDLLASVDGGLRVAAYFRYDWTLRSGPAVVFDCCDLFEFAEPDGDADDGVEPLVRGLTIVFDAAPVRAGLGDHYRPVADAPIGA
jgi:ketosteroid isomerase-like protein